MSLLYAFLGNGTALPMALVGLFASQRKTKPVYGSERLLEHPIRKTILDTIRRLKGLNGKTLADEAGLTRSTLRHHLRLLERRGVVKKVALGREAHYFPDGKDAEKAQVLARLRHGRAWNVLAEVLKDPGVRQKDLCERLSMTRKVLRGHLKVLLEVQLVLEHARGRMRRYWPGRNVDQGVWSLFGLENTASADVHLNSGIGEYRVEWSGNLREMRGV